MTNGSERPLAWLALEDGTVLEGRSVGAPRRAGGDLVFNTAMTGYQEILTDPSYAGQVVVMTYPLIGNYGVAAEDAESARAWAEAFVIREMSSIPSNRRATSSLPDWLDARGVVAIEGVDTRRLTQARAHGGLAALRGVDGRLRRRLARRQGAPRRRRRTAATWRRRSRASEPYEWTRGLRRVVPGAWLVRRAADRPALRRLRLRRQAQHPAQPRALAAST